PLSDAVGTPREQDVFVMDWGMYDNLAMLHQGKLNLWIGGDAVAPDTNPVLLGPMVARQNAVFLTYTQSLEVTPGTHERLLQRAGALGYMPRLVRTIEDRNGRTVFEIWKFDRRP